ncbi:uncharacterized protein DNG_05516 [Cephalotrichum gorgonifer]|uniref:Nonsense-mediated mRNA decay factor n=1 Tax=Cephalotrichum gorgonifer TaxID=2041049 RepID=A0AAE8MYD3_9PEZI|nr:uncharacterized protein DNG_05516 [Cephalotrichum gorgonifer]
MASEAAADKTADVAGVWKHAQKILKVIQKETKSLKRASPSEITDAKWKSLEDAMSQYRLACVGILFQDLEFADQSEVEKALWTSHILINNIYRHVSKHLPSDMRAKIRSVESQYNRFITTSQLFYKGYIQRLSQRYNIRSLHRIASAVEVQHGPQRDTINTISPSTQARILRSVQETLTYLGDLARYRGHLRPNGRDNQSAVTYYSLAHDVSPDRGYALHQIGVTYLESDKHLDVVYYFFLSLARSTPHPNAQRNLESKLKTVQANRANVTSSQSTQKILEGRVAQLFANYMTNTSFAGRDELEKTVLARLEQFLQSPHPTEVVIKTVLVAMGAYYYAKKQQGPSLGAVYTLSFTLQLLRTICQSIRSWVREARGVMPGESETENSRIAAARDISPGVDTAIRVLRLFCCWLSCHAEDLAHAPQPVQPAVESAWKDFAQTVTELVDYMTPDIIAFCHRRDESSPATAPYLLREDEEAVCYLAVGDASSEVYQRLFHRDDSTRKPTSLEFGDDLLSAEDELIHCLEDIIYSTQRFSESSLFPITLRDDGSGNRIVDYGYDTHDEPAQPQAILPDQAKPADTVTNGTELGKDSRDTVGTPRPAKEANIKSPGDVYYSPTTELNVGPKMAMDVGQPRAELSPKFCALPWSWFHTPAPTGVWTWLTREVYDSLLPAHEPAAMPPPTGAEDSQREMLLRMLRSAPQATPQDGVPKAGVPAHSQGTFQTGHPNLYGLPLSPRHNYGTVNAAASPSNPALGLNMVPYLDGMGEQADAYMLYQQDQLHHHSYNDQLHQQAYNAQLSQQIEQQMAAIQLTQAQGRSRPRSSRGNAGRRGRNHAEEPTALAGSRTRRAQRSIGGP